METVSIDGSQLQYLELIRVGLSEGTTELRLTAIKNVKHDAVTHLLELSREQGRDLWSANAVESGFAESMLKTQTVRHEALYEFMGTARRYEDGNERRLNIAEQIGKLVWCSIKEEKLEGLHTSKGILEQIRTIAQHQGIRGAKDHDTLRKIWNTYRGVVHLGIAMDYLENSPNPGVKVLHLAENIRRDLSQHCPKRTKKPYVDPDVQISFLHNSMV